MSIYLFPTILIIALLQLNVTFSFSVEIILLYGIKWLLSMLSLLLLQYHSDRYNASIQLWSALAQTVNEHDYNCNIHDMIKIGWFMSTLIVDEHFFYFDCHQSDWSLIGFKISLCENRKPSTDHFSNIK